MSIYGSYDLFSMFGGMTGMTGMTGMMGMGCGTNYNAGTFFANAAMSYVSLFAQSAGGGSKHVSAKQERQNEVAEIDKEIEKLQGNTNDKAIEKELGNYKELSNNISIEKAALDVAQKNTRDSEVALSSAKTKLKTAEDALIPLDSNDPKYAETKQAVETAKENVTKAEEAVTKAKAEEETAKSKLAAAEKELADAVQDYKDTKIEALQEKRRDILADGEKIKLPKDFDTGCVYNEQGEYVSIKDEIGQNTELTEKQQSKAQKEAIEKRKNAFNAKFSQYSNETDPDKKEEFKEQAKVIYKDINNYPDEIDKDLKRRYKILTEDKPSIEL